MRSVEPLTFREEFSTRGNSVLTNSSLNEMSDRRTPIVQKKLRQTPPPFPLKKHPEGKKLKSLVSRGRAVAPLKEGGQKASRPTGRFTPSPETHEQREARLAKAQQKKAEQKAYRAEREARKQRNKGLKKKARQEALKKQVDDKVVSFNQAFDEARRLDKRAKKEKRKRKKKPNSSTFCETSSLSTKEQLPLRRAPASARCY